MVADLAAGAADLAAVEEVFAGFLAAFVGAFSAEFFVVLFVWVASARDGFAVDPFTADSAVVFFAADVAVDVARRPVFGPDTDRRLVAADLVALAVIVEAPSCSVRRMRGSLTNSRAEVRFLQ